MTEIAWEMIPQEMESFGKKEVEVELFSLFLFYKLVLGIVQSTGGERLKWSISDVFLHILARDQ